MSAAGFQAWDFIVKRTELSTCEVLNKALPTVENLAKGNILVKIERYGLTANNVLYAVLGEQNYYWDLFPTKLEYGIIPVWGYGVVVHSKHADINAGERLFGLFPMATHIEMEVADVNARRFRDASPHRRRPDPVYSSYRRIGDDEYFTGISGDISALFRPIFMVSFMAEVYLSENKFFDADSIVISSASSKTAIALAYLVHTRAPSIKVIGLTSENNEPFVKSLGYYDETVLYDDVTLLSADEKTVFYDVAGNVEVRAALHRHFGDNVKHSARVGMAHWTAAPTSSDLLEMSRKDAELPGAAPQLFFAPPYMEMYTKKWGGRAQFMRRHDAVFGDFVQSAQDWVKLVEYHGPEQIRAAYKKFLTGNIDPEVGFIFATR